MVSRSELVLNDMACYLPCPLKTTLVDEKDGYVQGDLHITFEVVYPVSLTEHQRTMLKAAFFLPQKLDAKQTKALRSFETAFRDETHGWITAFRKDGQQAT